MDIKSYMQDLGLQARKAAQIISRTDSVKKNDALQKIADIINSNQAFIISENKKDLDAGKQNGLDLASLDRLTLTPVAINSMIEGLKQVAALPDQAFRSASELQADKPSSRRSRSPSARLRLGALLRLF